MVARVLSIARGQFYLGWMIVAVGFISEFMLVSMRSYVSGVFLKPMGEELHLTRAAVSSVISVGWLVEGVITPVVGPIVDKRGARGLMIVGAVISAVGYAALGLVQGLGDFYLLRGVLTTIGFTCAGHLVINVAISNWFVRQRGKAVAISYMGVSLGGAVLTPVAVYLIGSYGWRWAWVVFGVAILFIVTPPAALFMRRRPEDVGLLPDGDSAESRESRIGQQASTLTGEETWTRREAMRTSALWLTILAFGPGAAGTSAVAIHLFPFLTDIGLSEGAAGAVFSTYATSGFLFRPLWGVLIDRYQVRRCAPVALLLLALEVTMFGILSLWQPFWLIYLAAIFAGLATSGQAPVTEVYWANSFGRRSLGAVRSVASPFTIVFAAIGPLFVGWIYDRMGSYMVAWVVLSVAYASGAALVSICRPPKKRVKADDAARGELVHDRERR